MLPFKKILCPTDFSEPSYEALKVADELALHFSAELYLVHVVTPVPTVAANIGPSAFNINSYQLELENAARSILEQLAHEKVHKEIKVHTIVTHGNAAEKILQTASDKNTALIVIATHGKTGWRNVLFGSVAERIVRLSQVPVLTTSGEKKG